MHFLTILDGSVRTILRSFLFLGFIGWFKFWFGSSDTGPINLGGVKLKVRATSLRQKVVDLFVATYCLLDLEYIRAGFEIGDRDVVIDVGGHIGSFTILAASRARHGQVYTFEPDGNNYAQLKQNVELNQFSNVVITQMAVGAKSGTRIFYRDDNNDSSSSFTRETGAKKVVPIVSLAEVFKSKNIVNCDFLKLDCEGSEYEIIFDSPKELFKKISRIAIEVHDAAYFNLNPVICNKKHLVEYLTDLGYTCQVIQETNLHDLIFAKR